MGHKPEPDPSAPPPSKLARIARKIWWFHSFFALSFGVGVMLFARNGLAYADKLLMALLLSWSLMFVALRFIVGPTNRVEGEGLGRKGVRLATNYIIKQFYQQMFFFLVPLYASSATWSLSSFNWWLAPVLLVCAVVSTMDLVFDNFIMERRLLAAVMYGFAMFGLLNVLLPLAFGLTHLEGLMFAAGATPGAVALLSFRLKTVMSPSGMILTVGATAGLLVVAWFGRALVPPAPMAMPETAVGHGSVSSYECLPPSKHVIRESQLDGLRCGSWLTEPGGIKEGVVHLWKLDGKLIARVVPDKVTCDGDGVVYRSVLPDDKMPADPKGKWACVTETRGGQLVGMRKFVVTGADGTRDGTGGEDAVGTGTDGGSRDAAASGDGGVAHDGGAARDAGVGR